MIKNGHTFSIFRSPHGPKFDDADEILSIQMWNCEDMHVPRTDHSFFCHSSSFHPSLKFLHAWSKWLECFPHSPVRLYGDDKLLSTRPDQFIPPRDHRHVCVRTPAGRDEWEGMMQKKSYFHKQICHGIVQLLVLRLKRAIETQNISQPFYTRTQREIWMGKRSLYMCPFSHESLALSMSLSIYRVWCQMWTC